MELEEETCMRLHLNNMASCQTKEQEMPYLYYGCLCKGLLSNYVYDDGKEFDTVKHKLLMDLLQALDVDQAQIWLLISLYWNQIAAVRCDDDISACMSIKRGVRQGSVASPHLFTVYTEMIRKELGDMVQLSII